MVKKIPKLSQQIKTSKNEETGLKLMNINHNYSFLTRS